MELIVKRERRLCAVLLKDDTEKMGFFHKWSDKFEDLEVVDYGLVEMADGTMHYVPAESIRFLHLDEEVVCPKLYEEQLNKLGILNGDAQ